VENLGCLDGGMGVTTSRDGRSREERGTGSVEACVEPTAVDHRRHEASARSSVAAPESYRDGRSIQGPQPMTNSDRNRP
jgi:hypothetical protein